MTYMLEKELTARIIGAALAVHKHWGPGLLEGIYEKSFCRELALEGIPFNNQVRLPLKYKGEIVGDDLKLDLLVDKKVVVENKAVSDIAPIYEAQLLTYMKLTGCRVGLLINFNVNILKEGIKRFVL